MGELKSDVGRLGLLGVAVHSIRHLARVWPAQAPQRSPHRFVRCDPHPDIPRVLPEVSGRHVAPVANMDGDIDPEVELRVGEA